MGTTTNRHIPGIICVCISMMYDRWENRECQQKSWWFSVLETYTSYFTFLQAFPLRIGFDAALPFWLQISPRMQMWADRKAEELDTILDFGRQPRGCTNGRGMTLNKSDFCSSFFSFIPFDNKGEPIRKQAAQSSSGGSSCSPGSTVIVRAKVWIREHPPTNMYEYGLYFEKWNYMEGLANSRGMT